MTDSVDKSSYEDVHTVQLTPLVLAKYILSVVLLIFSIILVGALMFTGNTRVSSETNPWVCLLVCVSMLLPFGWLCILIPLSFFLMIIQRCYIHFPHTPILLHFPYKIPNRSWPSRGSP
jgi:hypothetical protein